MGDETLWRFDLAADQEQMLLSPDSGARFASILEVDRSLLVWDPVNATGIPINASDGRLELKLDRVEEHFLGSFRPGGAPRSHHRPRELPDGRIVLERRNVVLQYASLWTRAHIVAAEVGTENEDTLFSFAAHGYGRNRAGVTVCCGRPLFFAAQANWDMFSGGTLVVTTGTDTKLLIIDTEHRTVDTLDLGWPVEGHSHEDRVWLAVKEAESMDWSPERDLDRYRSVLSNSPTALSQAFSPVTPVTTQLVRLDARTAAVRGFDTRSWPHGLASRWTIVDVPTRLMREVLLPIDGVVLDAHRFGDRVRFLSTARSSETGHALFMTDLSLPLPPEVEEPGAA